MAQLERMKETALRFYEEHLLRNDSLRRACEDREQFQKEYRSWKAAEQAAGRRAVGGGGSILFQLGRMKIVKVSSGEVVNYVRDPLPGLPVPASAKERVRAAVQRVRDAREELEKDRHDIEVGEVTLGYDTAGNQAVVRPNATLSQTLTVKNRGKIVVLMQATEARAASSGLVIGGCGDQGTFIQPYNSHNLTLAFTSTNLGVVRFVLVLTFSCERSFGTFSITRHVTIRVGDPDAALILRPTAPFRRVRPTRDDGVKFRDAEAAPTEKSGQPKFVRSLKPYVCPVVWRDSLAVGEAEELIRNLLAPRDPYAFEERPQLRLDNHAAVLQRLLWTEEAQMEMDIRSFDMSSVKLMARKCPRASIYRLPPSM